jgi:hypothetical protein
MDLFLLALVLGVVFFVFKTIQQRQRIALLGAHLSPFHIEKLMETLTQGYLRALGEPDPVRRDQIWALMEDGERALSEQFERFCQAMARLDSQHTRVSRIAFALPFSDHLPSALAFDLREALKIHARGISAVVQNHQALASKDKAHMLLAELFLMQHTCHWFCRSKTLASARLLARHQTSYQQVLASVSRGTRDAYGALIGA